MAFKNLLPPNAATATRFLKTTGNLSIYKGTPVLSPVSDGVNIKFSTGVDREGIFISPSNFPVTVGLPYTFWIDFTATLGSKLQIWVYSSAKLESTPNIVADGSEQTLAASCNPSGSTVNLYILAWGNQTPFTAKITKMQFEQNDHATSYEFPGLDLTGNSITSNEAVQNLKLNQELKMFATESLEQVQNLTVENILQLLQVPSSEYVNNLEICNSIFMEAIESTETVNELIAWVACEFMKCNITMKTPKTILKMKYPR